MSGPLWLQEVRSKKMNTSTRALLSCPARTYLSLPLVVVFLCVAPAAAEPVGIEEILRAVSQTAEVEVARARSGVAAAELDQARSGRLPNVTLDAQGDIAGEANAREPEYVLRVEQTLLDWGATDETIAGRRSTLVARQSAEAEALLDAALTATEAFYSIAAINQKLEANSQSRESLRELEEMMRRRVANNVSPQIELGEVVTRIDLLEIAAHGLGSERRRQQLVLERLTGTQVDEPVVGSCAVETVSDEAELIRSALEASPTLARIRLEAEAYQSDAASLDASGRPTVVAGYRSDSDLDGGGFDQRAYLALRYELQTGGELGSRVAQARARYIEQQALLRKSAETITQTVSSWASAYQTSLSLAGVYRRIVDSRTEQRASHLRRFMVGRSSWRDVLNAHREVTEARVAEIDSVTRTCLALRSLELLAGGYDVGAR